MGLHVGGIYVEASRVSQADVVRLVRAYWARLGARESSHPPLDHAPLKLEETGRLAFAVSKPLPAADESGTWIAVYDSERYRADPALARELATALDTDVWFYEITASVDAAYAKRYGKTEQVLRGEDAIGEAIGPLPYALLYFNQLKDAPDAIPDFDLLAFEGIPHRPNAKYTGPSAEIKASQAKAKSAEELVAARDGGALAAMAGEHRVMWEVIKPAVERANLRDPRDCAFVHALADVVLQNDSVNWYVAEAALRMGDRATFERGLGELAEYQASLAAHRAHAMFEEKEYDLAFAMLEQITRSASAAPSTYNNALYALFHAKKPGDLSSERLDALFARACAVGPTNPALFHNLACVYMKLGRNDDALDAVTEAVRWGYERCDAMRTDDDLAPLRADPRFDAAFTPKAPPLDHLALRSATRGRSIVTIAPVVMLSLFFESRRAATKPLADLLALLVDELPSGTFSHTMWGSGACSWSPLGKGKLARDITALRKFETGYSFALRWGSHDGEPLGHRVSLDLDEDDGALDILLPLADAEDVEALATRMVRWAAMVPFAAGVGGLALGIYEEGPVVGAGSHAEHEMANVRPRWLGLGVSRQEAAVHTWAPSHAPAPGWLTFLGPRLVDELGGAKTLGEAVAPAAVGVVGTGVCVRAAKKPFAGLVTAPGDLGALPAVARALAKHRVSDATEVERLDRIAALEVPSGFDAGIVPGVAASVPVKAKPARRKSKGK